MTKDISYPRHSIGEHLIDFTLVFPKDESVEETLLEIKQKVGSWPNSETIFVVDNNNKLTGVVDFKKLVTAPSSQKLADIMSRNFQALTDRSHQNTAIKLAINKGVESIPITDQNGHFLGIIDSGQILKIMHEEHIEKLMHFSGILNNNALVSGYKARVLTVVKSRLPWLLLGLIGGILSTFIAKIFSHTLETKLALAFFIPVIVYMNDAVGTQTQTVFVRYSALEKIDLIKALLFEFKVSIFVSIPISLIIYLFGLISFDSNIGLIVSLSMFLGMLSSAFIGTVIPWCLDRLGKDPAIGSGPFATIIQDLLSVAIYFSIASILL